MAREFYKPVNPASLFPHMSDEAIAFLLYAVEDEFPEMGEFNELYKKRAEAIYKALGKEYKERKLDCNQFEEGPNKCTHCGQEIA